MKQWTTVRMSQDIKRELGIRAAIEGIPLRELLDEISQQWLDQQPPILVLNQNVINRNKKITISSVAIPVS